MEVTWTILHTQSYQDSLWKVVSGSTYLSIYLSVYRSVYLSICLSIVLSDVSALISITVTTIYKQNMRPRIKTLFCHFIIFVFIIHIACA